MNAIRELYSDVKNNLQFFSRTDAELQTIYVMKMGELVAISTHFYVAMRRDFECSAE